MAGRILDLLTGLSAFIAAVLWFWSASVALPRMKSYWDSAPPDDPFYVAVRRSAKLNALAAIFTGLSALLVFVKVFIGGLGVLLDHIHYRAPSLL